MTRRSGHLTLTVVLAALLLAGSAAASDERYHGRVVDADTNEPLPGAVVTVIWMKRPIVSMNGVSAFHDAREVLTGADGRFSVGAKPAWNLNPFRTLTRQPEIIVYKPGYGPFPGAYSRLTRARPVALDTAYDTLHARQAATIPLPRLTTPHEQEMFAHTSLHPDVPLERVAIYAALVNEQRVQVGFEPIPIPNVQRRNPGDR